MGIVPLSTHTSPAGRLEHFIPNWELVTKDHWVLNTVRGYQIEFASQPQQVRKPHPSQFNVRCPAAVGSSGGDRALQKGGGDKAQIPTRRGLPVNTVSGPEEGWGQRPVVNLKKLNSFVEVPHFKMEGIHTVNNQVMKADWLIKIDLKDAYFSIPIDQDHRKFLCLQVGDQIYQFNCLPFGLTSAPWVFTKTLKPVVALGRELGIRLVVYIDDILLMAESKEKVHEQAEGLIYLLQCLGYTINVEKTITEPTQSLAFLGFTLDTRAMELS